MMWLMQDNPKVREIQKFRGLCKVQWLTECQVEQVLNLWIKTIITITQVAQARVISDLVNKVELVW